ncbi:EEP domain-containing protein [Veronia nyctiphanis]|uniref:EEP domain-containing protein n=1 Tax=Veronia nyctiphanis TaxID=1278244 RepID=A0A4Q0YL18_9GAMM|nr:endonuclease/exonuclease/phosphatase family protein [Veronia nyctiphanis]RXJ71467.1 EEP domain-containing protein [Veronia nyctiphanis]
MSLWRRRSIVAGSLALMIGGLALNSLFTVPDSAQLYAAGRQPAVECRLYPLDTALNVDEPLTVSVWNIYKQQRQGWDRTLTELAEESQLILLQEATGKPALHRWINAQGLHDDQVYAFSFINKVAGVMTLSRNAPREACAYRAMEPYLRLPKSAIRTVYPLSDGRLLTVINLHAVNFTVGTEEYQQQINALVDAIKAFEGPLIVAGDFNSWNSARNNAMKKRMGSVGLRQVDFQSKDDRRLRVFGMPLDHVFYRGLLLEKASVVDTDTSDHTPLVIRFRFQP